jgi:hypothetical protein
MTTPEEIKEHANKYHDGIWREYSFDELAHWTNNFLKRSTHRTNAEKKAKDIKDGLNYARMFLAKAEELAESYK